MTFMAGVLPNRETRPLTERINNITANLQLLSMNNLTAHGRSGMAMSDGFVDTFQDATGADLSLSTAHYPESGRYFSEVPGQTGLTKLIGFNGAANLEMSDPNDFSVTESGLSLKRNLGLKWSRQWRNGLRDTAHGFQLRSCSVCYQRFE